MDIIIRKADKNDLKDILSLVNHLAIYEKAEKEVIASLSEYEDAHDSGLIEAHVAVANGKTIGMALYYMTFSTWKGKMLYLEDFYVLEEYRSTGVGQKLFDKYLAEARKQNCRLTKWQVLDWNEKAIKFYERNGATIEKEWYNGKIIF